MPMNSRDILKNSPLVSIVIPVYNGGNYVREAIDSALAQTHKNIEVIVVNDGSNDNGLTKSIALSYGDQIIFIDKVNGGVATALNAGINAMKGQYFSWLSHDDVYFKNKIEFQLASLSYYPSNTILYSGFSVINDKSELLYQVNNRGVNPDNFILDLLCFSGVHGCSTLIPKECFEKVGMFNERLLHLQDVEYWIRASKYYVFTYLNESLIQSRHHGEQTSRIDSATQSQEKESFIIDVLRDKVINKMSVFKYYPISYVCMKKNRYENVVLFLDECIKNTVDGKGVLYKIIFHLVMLGHLLVSFSLLTFKYIFNSILKAYTRLGVRKTDVLH